MATVREIPTGETYVTVELGDLTSGELVALIKTETIHNDNFHFHVLRSADGSLHAVTSGKDWELNYEDADDDDNEGE